MKTEQNKKSQKAKFWVRFLSFVILSVVAPVVYIIIRFKPFSIATKTSVSIGFAGIIACIIVLVCSKLMMKFYLDGMKTKFSMTKQIIDGINKVVFPLIIMFVVFFLFENYASQLIEIVSILIPCEFLAIIVNPLPQWAFENNVDGLVEIVDKIIKKEK